MNCHVPVVHHLKLGEKCDLISAIASARKQGRNHIFNLRLNCKPKYGLSHFMCQCVSLRGGSGGGGGGGGGVCVYMPLCQCVRVCVGACVHACVRAYSILGCLRLHMTADTKRNPSFRTYLLTSVVMSFQQLGHSSGAITIQYKTNVRRELIWLFISMITTVRKLANQLWTL